MAVPRAPARQRMLQPPVFQRFFGTSEELRPLTLPRGYGYPITARDRWRASWMVMNHQPITRRR